MIHAPRPIGTTITTTERFIVKRLQDALSFDVSMYEIGEVVIPGKIEVTPTAITISVGGRDIMIELFNGQFDLQVFLGKSPDPYITHQWEATNGNVIQPAA